MTAEFCENDNQREAGSVLYVEVGSVRTGTFFFNNEPDARKYAKDLNKSGCPFSAMIYRIIGYVHEDGTIGDFDLHGKQIEREIEIG